MQATYFVTITGLNHYYGAKPFKIGRIFKLVKEPDNDYDEEAICACLPFIDRIGYVANSTNTVYQGTISAGRIYDKIEDYAYARTMFITHSSVIALVLDKEDVEESDDEISTEVETDLNKSGKKSKKTSNEKLPIGFKGE